MSTGYAEFEGTFGRGIRRTTLRILSEPLSVGESDLIEYRPEIHGNTLDVVSSSRGWLLFDMRINDMALWVTSQAGIPSEILANPNGLDGMSPFRGIQIPVDAVLRLKVTRVADYDWEPCWWQRALNWVVRRWAGKEPFRPVPECFQMGWVIQPD